MQRIGFIGLGTMGLPMVRNLLRAGYAVHVVSRSRGPIETAVSLGAMEAESPRDLAEKTEIVLTCLPLPATIEAVYFGENGILQADLSGKLIIDHSTVSPLLNRRCDEAIRVKGGRFLDAPLSGGPMGAEAATLAIMCGGQAEDYARALPVLQAMGKHLFHIGPVGSGSFVKLMNNYLIGVHTAALAETFTLAAKAGIDSSMLFDVIAVSTGESKMLHRIVPLVHQRDFAPRFSNELLHKDMKLATELAQSYGVEMPINQLAEEMYALAKEKFPKEDMAALFKIYEEKVGVTVLPGKKE